MLIVSLFFFGKNLMNLVVEMTNTMIIKDLRRINMKKLIIVFILFIFTACNNTSQINYEQQSNMVNKDNIQSQNIVLGTYATKLTDKTENRLHNINLGVSILDGTRVEAGETFSFNDTIGERTADTGFKEAIIFDGHGNKTQGYGGGLCQISSTLYNAVLGASLPVEERHEHSHTVPYVNAGDDATVSYYANEDFKFTNTLDVPITIYASAEDDKVTITLKK